MIATAVEITIQIARTAHAGVPTGKNFEELADMRGILCSTLLIMAWIGASCQSAAALDNPLIGTWVLTDKGWGGCAETQEFMGDHQHRLWKGIPRDAPAIYSVQGSTVYVQSHQGHGGTDAYVVVGPNEIMDTKGSLACHWRRQ